MSVSRDAEQLGVPFVACDNATSKKLLVFLPAVRSRDIYPYFPRIGWKEQLSKHLNVLYLADPYQEQLHAKEAGGSWFLDEDGSSALPRIAEWLNSVAAQHELDEIVLYGSSMGGYAAIVLGTLVKDATVFAECPQIFLDKHPGSSSVLAKAGVPQSSIANLSALAVLRAGAHRPRLNLLVSLHDPHLQVHLLPLMDALKEDSFERMSLMICSSERYAKGHVALDLSDALVVLEAYVK